MGTIGVSRRDLIGRRVGQSPVAGGLQGSAVAREVPVASALTSGSLRSVEWSPWAAAAVLSAPNSLDALARV